MTDEEIGRNVSKALKELCLALDAAGEAGLQIGDVQFNPSYTAWGGGQPIKRTGWQGYVSVNRVAPV